MNQGYIALISAIIISLVLLALTLTLSSAGFFSRFNLLETEYKEISLALAEACGEEALLKLAQNPAYLGREAISVGKDSCLVGAILHSGEQVTIKTRAIFQNSVTNLKITAKVDDLSLVSWEEVSDF